MYGQPSRKLARTLLAAGAILAGCSEAPNPTAPVLPPSLAVGDITATPQLPVFGKILVCKTAASNIAGTFTVVRNSGTGAFTAAPTVAANTCVEVANDFSATGGFSSFTITENAAADPANTTQALISCLRTDNVSGVITGPVACGVPPTNLPLNNFHSWVFTYQNIFTQPPVICTYTKGWYQNKNGAPTIVLTIDGRTPNQQRAIFEASPGQPGSVTWGVDNKPNNLLNLYQQLLAAINNLGGNLTAGPAAVDAAIAAALAGTGGTVLNITTTLTGTQISDLINVLSAFNEGTFAGFPHCDDEVLTD